MTLTLHIEGRGPAVLLLHAFPLHSRMWQRQIAALAGKYTVLAPDLPGFGDSRQVPKIETLEGMAQALRSVLLDRVVDRAVVIGNSMGGYLAFALLRAWPEFVLGLGLINTRAAADSEQGRAKRLDMVERVKREGASFLAAEWPPTALTAETLQHQPSIVEFVRSIVAEATPAGVIGAQLAMASREDATPLLAQIQVPTVVIHGVADAIIPEAEARKMASAIRGARFIGVADAAHLPSVEQPAFVNGELERLIADCL